MYATAYNNYDFRVFGVCWAQNTIVTELVKFYDADVGQNSDYRTLTAANVNACYRA